MKSWPMFVGFVRVFFNTATGLRRILRIPAFSVSIVHTKVVIENSCFESFAGRFLAPWVYCENVNRFHFDTVLLPRFFCAKQTFAGRVISRITVAAIWSCEHCKYISRIACASRDSIEKQPLHLETHKRKARMVLCRL